MSEPPTLPPMPPTRPFSPEERPTSGGCSKPLWIGCGVLVVLLGISVIVMAFKAKDLFAWAMGQLQSEVVAALPADVTDAERDRLEAAFVAAVARIRSGEFDAAKLQLLQGKLQEAASKAGAHQLKREDVVALTAGLEDLAGLAPVPDAEPAASPPPEPQR